MGVSGLWDIIGPAGVSRSLTHLAVVDGFESNPSGRRAYRIGIDASIWYKHAAFSKGGENPELRLLFFRLRHLAELPILPLFIFDGRERPKIKRGSKMGKSGSHNMTQKFKELLDAFGMEWRMALGEAEAELAFLNRTGVVDAIMTDDVDALVFGANAIIRNVGSNLSGNKSNPALRADGKKSKEHTMVFSAEAIRTNPAIQMTRGGMILFALMAGGDYDKGVDKFGKAIAHALARCGFGDELLYAFERRETESLHLFFPAWRHRMNQELATNSRGFLERAYPRLNIPPEFPNLQMLEYYAAPRCSASIGQAGGGHIRGNKEMNLGNIAGFCEKYFEWGTRSEILKRFGSLMWKAAVLRVLRRACMEQDDKEADNRIRAGNMDRRIRGAPRSDRNEAVGTPASLVKKYLNMSAVNMRAEAFANRGQPSTVQASQEINDTYPLLTKLHSNRRHASTDNVLEYRVEINPRQLVELALAGIKGTRPDKDSGSTREDYEIDSDTGERVQKKQKKNATANNPHAPLRMWIPASMLWRVHPGLVEDFELGVEERAQRRAGGGRRRARDEDEDTSEASGNDDPTPPAVSTSTTRAPRTSQPKARAGTGKRKTAKDQQPANDIQRAEISRPRSIQPFPMQLQDTVYEEYLPTPPATQPIQPSRLHYQARPASTVPSLSQPLPSQYRRTSTQRAQEYMEDIAPRATQVPPPALLPTANTSNSSAQLDPNLCRLNVSTREGIFLFSYPHPDDPTLIEMPVDDAPSFKCQWASLDDRNSDDGLDDPFGDILGRETVSSKGKNKAGAKAPRVPSVSTKRSRMSTSLDDPEVVGRRSSSSSYKRPRTSSSVSSRPASSSSLEIIDISDDDNDDDELMQLELPLFLPPLSSSPPPSSSPPRGLSRASSRSSMMSSGSRSFTQARTSSRRTSRIFDDVERVVDLTARRSRKSLA